MPDLFSASELINIAIREEANGAAFYRALAERTNSNALKEFALRTAAMEDEHAAKFRKLLKDVGSHQPVGESYDGEYMEYVAYLVEGRIFPMGEDATKMAKAMKTDRQAVEAAAEMEKNTLLLYQELLNFVPERDRALLKGIMDEERMHLLQFTRFKTAKL